jgi:ferredoxin
MLYQQGNCLNTKKTFTPPCRICVAVCPHGAISEGYELSEKQCTECGLCAAACPSNGFVDRLAAQLEAYLWSERKEYMIHCPQAASGEMEIPCIGILDRDSWSTLIMKAASKTVTLITGDCGVCPDQAACAASVRIFKELHRDWPGHPEVKVLVQQTAGEATDPAARNDKETEKKRGKDLRRQSRKLLGRWLPEAGTEAMTPIPRSRRWLLRVLEEQPQQKAPFQALTVSGQCTNCSVCVSVCPQGALDDREEDGRRLLILEPLKCVQCGRCINVCRAKALRLETKNLSARLLSGKILIHEGNIRTCTQCGRRVYDDREPPLCVICASASPEGRDHLFSSSKR